MNITTTCTDRKPMARGLAEHLGCDCEYLRAPTYAFRVGSLQVERDGSITGERTDLEAAAGWLLENGYISEPLPTEQSTTEEPATNEQSAEEEQPVAEQPVDTEAPATEEDSKAVDEQPLSHTCLNITRWALRSHPFSLYCPICIVALHYAILLRKNYLAICFNQRYDKRLGTWMLPSRACLCNRPLCSQSLRLSRLQGQAEKEWSQGLLRKTVYP